MATIPREEHGLPSHERNEDRVQHDASDLHHETWKRETLLRMYVIDSWPLSVNPGGFPQFTAFQRHWPEMPIHLNPLINCALSSDIRKCFPSQRGVSRPLLSSQSIRGDSIARRVFLAT